MEEQSKNFLLQAKSAFDSKNWEKLSRILISYLETQANLTEVEQIEALDLALAVLKEGDFAQRWEMAKIFKTLGRIAIDPLIEVAMGEDYALEIRWFAIRILCEFPEEKVIVILVKLAENSEEEISLAAAQALVSLGANSLEFLKNLLHKPLNRGKIIQALGQVNNPEIIEPLLLIVKDEVPEIRRQVLEVLGNFEDKRVSQALVEALQDNAAIVRKEASANLPRHQKILGDSYLVSRLKPLLYDLNPGVCIQAANSLGRLKTSEAAEALFAVVNSVATPTSLKINLVKSFLLIETKESLFYLERLLHNSEAELLKEIMVILGRFAQPSLKTKAAEVLLDFFDYHPLKLNLPDLKETLANSLGQLGQKSAIRILEKLKEDPQLRVRLHAQAALKKLDS